MKTRRRWYEEDYKFVTRHGNLTKIKKYSNKEDNSTIWNDNNTNNQIITFKSNNYVFSSLWG